MSSLSLFLGRLFPLALIGLAITCLFLSLLSDVSVIRNSPLVHLSYGQSLVLPILFTFFEAVLPLILAFGLYKSTSAHRSDTSRATFYDAMKNTLAKAYVWSLIAIVVLLATVSVLLDTYFAFSVTPLTTSICGLIWLFIGLRLMRPIRLRPKFTLLAVSLLLILSVKHMDWNSRRPFIRDLLKIKSGMPANEVDRVMKRYRRGSESSSGNERLFYMHAVKGPFYSDMGIVTLKDDKVEAVELQFD